MESKRHKRRTSSGWPARAVASLPGNLLVMLISTYKPFIIADEQLIRLPAPWPAVLMHSECLSITRRQHRVVRKDAPAASSFLDLLFAWSLSELELFTLNILLRQSISYMFTCHEHDKHLFPRWSIFSSFFRVFFPFTLFSFLLFVFVCLFVYLFLLT